jgi:hypothetical protein
MPKIRKSLAQYISEAITDDYLLTIAITSYTQAKHQTRNLPFGLGKTTLSMELAYLLNGGSVNDNYQRMDVWEKVKQVMVYDPLALAKLLEPGRQRLVTAIWDDVQATAPATQSVPRAIRQLANFISTERPEMALLIFTTPNLNFISAPLRKLVNFEIIVSERGYYEVHKISYYKNFRKPLQDNMHFDYVEEIPRNEPFPPLPMPIKGWYDVWRVERKQRLFPHMIKDIETYTKLKQWTQVGEIEEGELDGHWIRMGYKDVFVPDDQDAAKSLHGKNMKVIVQQQ